MNEKENKKERKNGKLYVVPKKRKKKEAYKRGTVVRLLKINVVVFEVVNIFLIHI